MKLFKTCDTAIISLEAEIKGLTEQLKFLNSKFEKKDEPRAEQGEKSLKRPARGDDLEAEILGEGRARDSIDQPVAKKAREPETSLVGKVVVVSGFHPQHEDALIDHMEKFGDVYDVHFHVKSGLRSGTFTYSTPADAQKAFEQANSTFPLAENLEVTWAKVALGSDADGGVIPDEQRAPEEQVTPASLLAAIDEDDNESDGSDA